MRHWHDGNARSQTAPGGLSMALTWIKPGWPERVDDQFLIHSRKAQP